MKSYGRKVKPWDNEKWNKNKMNIVEKGNFNKFSQNSDLKQFLLDTKNKRNCRGFPF